MTTTTMPPVATNALHGRDYVIIIDKSGSMATRDMPGGISRWQAAQESTYAIAAKVFELDPDGIDIMLFSNYVNEFHNVGPARVEQIFMENEPMGGTRMAEVLQIALNNYFAKRDAGKAKPNGEMILVVTDGQPDNRDDVINVLVQNAFRLRSSDKLAINFVQVGNDPSATEFLNFLDNHLIQLKGAPRDFVETVKLAEVEQKGLRQVLLNTITKTAGARLQ